MKVMMVALRRLVDGVCGASGKGWAEEDDCEWQCLQYIALMSCLHKATVLKYKHLKVEKLGLCIAISTKSLSNFCNSFNNCM